MIMGEKAKRVLREWRNRKRKPVYKVQGQNPTPESLPLRKQGNVPNSTKTNKNIETKEIKTTEAANWMFKGIIKFVRNIRQRRANNKKTSDDWGNLDFAVLPEKSLDESNRLWENLPPCSSIIRYIQEGASGEFLFRTTDVKQEIIDILQENPKLADDDEGAILNWVKRCDESLTEPTDVPSIWDRFQYVANNHVRAGKAKIHCRKCMAAIEPEQLATNDDSGKRGWNFDRVVCQQGHILLSVARVHLLIK